MSKKALWILSLLTVLIFGAAKFQSSKKQTPSLDAQALVSFDLGAVKSLTLSSKDKKIALKEASDGKWISLSSNGYEAQLSKVNALLLKVHDLKSNQKITSNPQNYTRLGLGDADKISLLLQDKDGKTLAALQFGKNWETPQKNPMMGEASGGRYVKADPGEAVYLISQEVNLILEQSEWLNTQFLKIEKKDIAEIQLLKTTPRLSIQNTAIQNTAAENKDRPQAPTFKLLGIQPGEKAKDWVVEQVADFFSSTYFTGVFPATDSKLMKASFQPLMELKTKEGLLYHVLASELEKKFYLKLSVEAPPTARQKEAGQKDADPALKEKASKLNASYSPWIYNLESWTAATLNKSYKDMIEEAPKPKTEAPKPGDPTKVPQQTPNPSEASKNQAPEPGKSTPVPTLG